MSRQGHAWRRAAVAMVLLCGMLLGIAVPGSAQPARAILLPATTEPIDSSIQYQEQGPPQPSEIPLLPAPPEPSKYAFDFTEGVLFRTTNDMFSLRINNLLQLDYRHFAHTGAAGSSTSLHDQFTIPRWWLYLSGNVTEYCDYEMAFASGAGGNPNTLVTPSFAGLLDAYVDLNPFGKEVKELFQVRLGRMKTPFLFQFYKWGPQDFVAPELSMYSTNFLRNRQIGAMAHGLLFDRRVDYAAGIFNGSQNTWEVSQNNREGIFYLGFQPFRLEEDSLLRNLYVAGSCGFGEEFGPVNPPFLGTDVAPGGPPNNFLVTPIFLTFGANTVKAGPQGHWAVDLLYSYRSFNFYGEYTAGNESFALTTAPGKEFPVSLSGYSALMSYFLTGEEIDNNNRRYIQPLRPYSWRQRGFGALEAYSRFSNLIIGSSIFADQLANFSGNANVVNTTDTGLNWFLNQYIKVTFDWQHAMFNNPVVLSPGKFMRVEDTFWFRCQLYY